MELWLPAIKGIGVAPAVRLEVLTNLDGYRHALAGAAVTAAGRRDPALRRVKERL